MSRQETNDCLRSLIVKGKPFMAGRLGSVELKAMRKLELPYLPSNLPGKKSAVINLCRNAGFFPEDIALERKFCQLMKQSCGQLDLAGVWFNPMEDYFLGKYGQPGLNVGLLGGLEPWYSEQPWTELLEGRRVMVIHPFAETIAAQYKIRDKIFPGTKLLPEFRLYTVKAVQTIAGVRDDRFVNWFEALEWMYSEAMKVPFDIAIIGCGAYGFPLAARLKAAGKMSVHLGGASQLLFGIKGKRWDEDPNVSRYYNDYWVRPSRREKPESAAVIEDACYW